MKLTDGSFLTQYFRLLVRFTTSLITTLRLETSAAYRELSGTKGHLGPGDSGYERHVLSEKKLFREIGINILDEHC